MRRALAAALAGVLGASVLSLLGASPAAACTPAQMPCSPSGSGGGGPSTPVEGSSGTRYDNYTSTTQTCSVYASGNGMGSYCVSLGGGSSVKTLRERFGGEEFQQCRYSDLPPGIQAPFNTRPSEGRYMLVRCLRGVDFDTYSGGRNRSLSLEIRFVEFGEDVADKGGELNNFLWNRISQDTFLPVPFLQPRPNPTPIVGVPTYLTFQWRNPVNEQVVAQGPFAGREGVGGPYIRIVTPTGLTMVAQATEVRLDPNQEGIDPVTCAPTTPYVVGAAPKDQPADACSITFPRSSASARKFATRDIPSNLQDSFYADVQVDWQVRYGEGDALQDLGDFTMRLKQPIPVQEVQAPNQPPAVIY